MDRIDLTDVVARTIRQAPQWVRGDLASKDVALRARAEDALAAMVAAAILKASAQGDGEVQD
jgi:hypothetical protein